MELDKEEYLEKRRESRLPLLVFHCFFLVVPAHEGLTGYSSLGCELGCFVYFKHLFLIVL